MGGSGPPPPVMASAKHSVHIGHGLMIHPTYARWFGIQSKPKHKPKTIRVIVSKKGNQP